MTTLGSSLREERGIILPFTLLIIMLLTTLTLALLAIGASEPQIASNLLRGTQALTVAEAGLERAIASFVATSSTVSNATCSPCPGSSVTLYASTTLGSTGSSTGSYAVTYKPIASATLLVESTGTNSIGTATRRVRAVVSTAFSADYAILAQDEVEASGNATINGNVGAIHSNTQTEVTGSAHVAQTATTTGSTCTGCTDSSKVGNTSGSGASKPSVSIPTFAPADYASLATVVLNDNSTITYSGTTYAENTSPFSGWRMHGAGEWEFSGSGTPPNGLYYATKEIKVSSSPGSSSTPWSATLVAGSSSQAGEVEIKGHATITPYYKDILTVAGEVEIEGTGGSASLTGVVMATSEVEIKGSASLTGNIISRGEVEISGSASVTYDTKTRTNLTGTLKVLSWSSVSY